MSPSRQIASQAGRSAGVACRSVSPAGPGEAAGRSAAVVIRPSVGLAAGERRLRGLARGEPLELGGHEGVEVAVEHAAGVRGLDRGPEVLDHLVRVEDVAPDLVAPAGLDVLAADLAELGLLLLEGPLDEPALQDL